jgi:hypothetical protein
MAEQRSPSIRSAADAHWVAQVGLVRGAALGAVLTLPLAVATGLLGAFLDAGQEEVAETGWFLAMTVLVAGGFVGAFRISLSDSMRDWPAICRERVWGGCRRGLAICESLGLPIAVLLGWVVWRSEGSWSFALMGTLEVSFWFAAVGVLVGGFRGEMAVRQVLEQAGYVRFSWLQYGMPTQPNPGAHSSPLTDGKVMPPDREQMESQRQRTTFGAALGSFFAGYLDVAGVLAFIVAYFCFWPRFGDDPGLPPSSYLLAGFNFLFIMSVSSCDG